MYSTISANSVFRSVGLGLALVKQIQGHPVLLDTTLLCEGGEQGYANPLILAIFLARSVNPTLYLFKSGSALLKNFPWFKYTAYGYIYTGICVFFFTYSI